MEKVDQNAPDNSCSKEELSPYENYNEPIETIKKTGNKTSNNLIYNSI